MNRRRAIAIAKEAWRLWFHRGIRDKALCIMRVGDGFVWQSQGWVVYLKDNGSLESAYHE